MKHRSGGGRLLGMFHTGGFSPHARVCDSPEDMEILEGIDSHMRVSVRRFSHMSAESWDRVIKGNIKTINIL